MLPQSLEGCTRLVSRIAKDRDEKSMTIEVPVYPVCPAVRGDDISPMYQGWSSSNPSPCESSGNSGVKFVMSSSTLSLVRIRRPRYAPPSRSACARAART